MITVACVLRSGGIYAPEHVRILEAMVSRNLDGIDRFVCLSDVPLDLPHVERIPLYHHWPGSWSKLELFRPHFKEGTRVLYFDLACVITGNLSSIASRQESFLACGHTSFHVMSWRANDLYSAYRSFARNPIPRWAQPQQLIVRHAPKPMLWKDVLPGQVTTSDTPLNEVIASDARVIVFSGHIKPWHVTGGFIQQHYTAEVSV